MTKSEILATIDSQETENRSGYLSESSQTISEKLQLDVLSSRGNN